MISLVKHSSSSQQSPISTPSPSTAYPMPTPSVALSSGFISCRQVARLGHPMDGSPARVTPNRCKDLQAYPLPVTTYAGPCNARHLCVLPCAQQIWIVSLFNQTLLAQTHPCRKRRSAGFVTPWNPYAPNHHPAQQQCFSEQVQP